MFEGIFDWARMILLGKGYTVEQIDDAFMVLHGDWRLLLKRRRERKVKEEYDLWREDSI